MKLIKKILLKKPSVFIFNLRVSSVSFKVLKTPKISNSPTVY